MSDNCWPEFIVPGVAKSGTTWLCKNLADHPEICTRKSEPHIFEDTSKSEKTIHADYAEFFRECSESSLLGENSNRYFYDPEIPEKIHGILPDVKLIFAFRNPVDRVYSSYCMSIRKNRVSTNIEQELDPSNPDCFEGVSWSRYHALLQNFLKHFSLDQMEFVIFDDIVNEPRKALETVYDFLGVRKDYVPETKDDKYSRKTYYKSRDYCNYIARALKKIGLAAEHNPANIKIPFLRRLLSKEIEYPDYPKETQAKLKNYFREEIQKLSKLLDRDLTHWVE